MVKTNNLRYLILFIVIIDISLAGVQSLKTSNKHKSMISKAKSDSIAKESTETKATSEVVEASTVPKETENENLTKKSSSVKDSSSSSDSSPASLDKHDENNINEDPTKVDDAETAISLLAIEPIEKDEDGEIVDADTSISSATTPGFLISRFREVFIQLLRMFGLRTSSSKRKHRTMDMSQADDFAEQNVIEPSNYKEQIRTTVGAVLGRPDCIKRAACRAGSYLRDVKGKDIIIVILEKVTPTKWLETIQVVKDSAIHNEECNYKCLED